jgi:hypothetical protein
VTASFSHRKTNKQRATHALSTHQRMPPAAPATSKFIRVGAPLLILVTSGWYALTTVISGKIEVRVSV